jgi:hypothetical protein
MKFSKKFEQILCLIGIVLIMAVAAFAATADTYDSTSSAGYVSQDVGGLPICVTFSGTSASSKDVLTVALPAGFKPTAVWFVDDYDGTNPNRAEWHRGMPANSAIITTGSTGVDTYSVDGTGNLDASTTGSLVIGLAVQVNSGNYVGRACR